MHAVLLQMTIYLAAAVIAVPVSQRLGFGSVLGYLAAGVAIGPILHLVAEHSTHTLVLQDGRVHAAGPTADLFRSEQTFESAGLRLPPLQRVLAASGWAIA